MNERTRRYINRDTLTLEGEDNVQFVGDSLGMMPRVMTFGRDDFMGNAGSFHGRRRGRRLPPVSMENEPLKSGEK